MSRERTIKLAVLSVVFVVATIVFSYWTNRGNADMTADMEAATLPVISFEIEGNDMNMLVGHKREMNVAAMRDAIAVYGENKKLKANVQLGEKKINSLKYEVYELDGKEQLLEKTVKKVEDTVTFDFGNALKKDQEGLLKITLECKGGPLYYYTRIAQDNGYYLKECLNYAMELHANILNKQNEEGVKKVLEPNAQANNQTLQHVTIHSDIKNVMWGSLKPEVTGEPLVTITEAKKAYTSILLQYQVTCAGDNNKEEVYNVKEFFKVTQGTKQLYLMEYDRTMEEVFDTSNVVLNNKGVILGVAEENLSHKMNRKGDIVAFVQANELWSYNKEEDTFSLVFSFADAGKEDVRNRTDRHSIRIFSMEDDGSMTFSVCGYMNRGNHEGESGVAIYYFNMEQNVVKEEAFIPSTQSCPVIEAALNELAYYSKEQNALYVMLDGTLMKIDSKKGEQTVLIKGLEESQYVTSGDGHLLACQREKDGQMKTEVWDFAKDSKWTVATEDGKVIVPLGFMGNDFVYGVSNQADAGCDVWGAPIQAMHRLEIQNSKKKVIKTYEKENVYILGATIKDNLITLKQGVKNGTVYASMEDDYITNNAATNKFVSLQSFWTDLKGTQYRFAFSEGLRDKSAKTLKPKQVLQESTVVLKSTKEDAEKFYYVYGHGKAAGAFSEPAEAILLAEQLSGVVVSPRQSYVWEADNRVAWYRNFNVGTFTAKEGETNLAACVRKVLAYEKESVDVVSELTSKTAEQILSEQLKTEAVRFRGCSVKDMFYLIDKGVPVIGLKNSTNAVLFVGYDAKTATYIDPTNGGTYTSSIEKVNEMLRGSGNVFIGYTK